MSTTINDSLEFRTQIHISALTAACDQNTLHEIVPVYAEAARELLIRQSEQGKDWHAAVFLLLDYIKILTEECTEH